MKATRNVVLFGECGVGKSSIINAIVGHPVARTSNDVFGCTDENAAYPTTLDTGITINLWDTIGLDEGTAGRIPADKARQYLRSFLGGQLGDAGGVDLLLYCVRGASGAKRLPVKQGHWDKYQFVFEDVCKKWLPMALIVTHLESYDTDGDMDTWWNDSEEEMAEFGFQFCAHACITTYGDANRIEVSRRGLQDLLSHNFLAPRNILLLGDREDRGDFINTMVTSCKKQNPEGGIPFTRIPLTLDTHTHANLWNMSGLDETDDDTLITKKNLKLLVHGIKQIAGIDLLLFCFRAGRANVRHTRNYNLFHAAICRKKVPVAIVVLGPEEVADAWWQRNEQELKGRGLRFDKHVYIPCDPCQLPSGDLDTKARRQLTHLVQEEHALGRWSIDCDVFWVTVPNVRAVIGELSWPTTTVIVCDATKQNVFVSIALDLQSSLQRSASSVGFRREHRFEQVDPQSLLTQSRASDRCNRGENLIMFFMPVSKTDSEIWGILERFHSIYKGNITPLIVVICGAPEKRFAEDLWRTSPYHIRRRVGAYLTYHPGFNTCPDTQTVAQEIMVDLILHRCLVDLGEKVGILREILSVWRRYHSQPNNVLLRGAR